MCSSARVSQVGPHQGSHARRDAGHGNSPFVKEIMEKLRAVLTAGLNCVVMC